jgi:MFS family permease
MSTNYLSIFPLLLSYGLLITANAMFSSLLALRSEVESFDLGIVGWMTALHSAGILLGARRAPDIVTRVGMIRAFAALASLVSIIALLHLLWINPLFWILLRFFNGMIMAGLFTVTESWLNARATGATRGRVLALYMITNYAAAGAGQLILPASSPDTFVLFCIASILFSLALIPLLMSRTPAPEPENTERMPLRKLIRVSRLGFSGAFCAGMIAAPVWGLGALYAQGIGLSLGQTSLFMAIVFSSGMVLQIPVGILSDRIGRRKVIGVMAGLSAIIAFALGVLPSSFPPWSTLAFAFFWGSTTLTLYALAVAHTNDQSPQGKTVEVATAILFVYGLGAIIGPLVASAMMESIGPRGLFLFQFLVAFGLCGIAFFRLYRNQEEDERKDFMPIATVGMTSESILAKLHKRRTSKNTLKADSAEH